jgi:hypothetical protein
VVLAPCFPYFVISICYDAFACKCLIAITDFQILVLEDFTLGDLNTGVGIVVLYFGIKKGLI